MWSHSNTRRNVLRGLGIGSAMVGLSVVPASATDGTPIDSCITIDEPGEYFLASDLDVEGDGVCIEITADDVTLYGEGHTIAGTQDDLTEIGVRVTGDDVTVQNVRFENCYVRYEGTDRGAITNDEFLGESDYGIFLDSSTNATILQNDLQVSEAFSIVLSESDDNIAFLNRIRFGETGVIVGASSQRNALMRNTITNIDIDGILIRGNSRFNGLVQNTVGQCETGVRISRSKWNALVSNRIVDNADGVILTESTQNLLLGNEVRNNSTVGVALTDADENVLLNNVVCDNATVTDSGEQIQIDAESVGNRLVGNQTTC